MGDKGFDQIAISLARHFDSVYYIDIETGEYSEFLDDTKLEAQDVPSSGSNFFEDAVKNADKFIHPDDLERMVNVFGKQTMLSNISDGSNYSVSFRSFIDGEVIHMRHISILSDDKKHIICCLENIEDEYQEKQEHKQNLKSAELMARRDELTGVKNKNAFKEFTDQIDKNIKEGNRIQPFAVAMFDVNDLKLINDTRGHSFGDEIIQRTSRMICEIYKHSPVFRVGGDEFVVILKGSDYEKRKALLKQLRDESESNRRSRTGPVVASGMAPYEEGDSKLEDVLERADKLMYINKNELKSVKVIEDFINMQRINKPIPKDRRRLLDAFFGAMYTISGGGYLFLNDMRYDFSRWSLPLIDDFGLTSEYMYHADLIWQDYIHPDDIEVYRSAVDTVLCGNAEIKPIKYRAQKKDGSYVALTTRGFVLSDNDGEPEYFGGIIIPA